MQVPVRLLWHSLKMKVNNVGRKGVLCFLLTQYPEISLRSIFFEKVDLHSINFLELQIITTQFEVKGEFL